MVHPFHDTITRTVRRWYLDPAPEMGYTTEARWFGVVRRNTTADFAAATVTTLDPDDVGRLVNELRETFGRGVVRVQIESATMGPSLDAALVGAGLSRGATTTYLVHEGPLPTADEPAGFVFDQIDATGISEFSRVKLRAFASSEAPPTASDIERENTFRRAELVEPNGFAIGRVKDEAAGIIGWYGGEDTLIFLVATRVPFRRRGLACAMVRRVLEHEHHRGVRSVLINADVEDDPVDLYRGLGFQDEVYREHIYELSI